MSCRIGHPSLVFTFLVVNREMVVSFMVKDSVGASSRFEFGSTELLIFRDRLRGSMVMLSHYFEEPLSSERILCSSVPTWSREKVEGIHTPARFVWNVGVCQILHFHTSLSKFRVGSDDHKIKMILLKFGNK